MTVSVSELVTESQYRVPELVTESLYRVIELVTESLCRVPELVTGSLHRVPELVTESLYRVPEVATESLYRVPELVTGSLYRVIELVTESSLSHCALFQEPFRLWLPESLSQPDAFAGWRLTEWETDRTPAHLSVSVSPQCQSRLSGSTRTAPGWWLTVPICLQKWCLCVGEHGTVLL